MAPALQIIRARSTRLAWTNSNFPQQKGVWSIVGFHLELFSQVSESDTAQAHTKRHHPPASD